MNIHHYFHYWSSSNIKFVLGTYFSTKSIVSSFASKQERNSLYQTNKAVKLFMDSNETITPSILNLALDSTLVTEHIVTVCEKVEKSGKI